MRLGLRIDVDTLRGTRRGVPVLLERLARHGVLATFLMSVGPDNMGRHLWRLLQPGFLAKLLRSHAPSLYGWDILLRGTFWPGPRIGQRLEPVLHAVAAAGHEVGLHAWDHHAWQRCAARWSVDAVAASLARGHALLRRAIGREPDCSGAPAWMGTDAALQAKAAFPYRYNSDCRGTSVFRPRVGNRALQQPQVPTTLPTYDEVIGRGGVTDATYNGHLFGLMAEERLNVLTIHAEVEGGVRVALFEQFLAEAARRRIAIVPLGALVGPHDSLPVAGVERRPVPGRAGWCAWQAAN